MSGQPTAGDRAVYDCVIEWDKDGHTSVGLDAITLHAAQAAAEREAQVIAGVVARLRELSGDEPLPKGCTTGEVWLLRAVADQFERGDWKGPSHAE